MPTPTDRTPGTKTIFGKVFSFPVMLGMFLVAGAVLTSRYRLPDPDLWNHIAIGREILATHTWSSTDHYSFTANGNESMVFEWMGSLAIALAERVAGLRGLMGLLMGLSALQILLIYYWANQRCRNSKAAFVACLLTLPLVAAFFTLRPQLIGFSFLLITLICLERFRQGHHRAVWLLPPLFLVWVNTHGSFMLGLLAVGLYFASGLVGFRWGGLTAVPWTPHERLRLEVVSLLSMLALTVTPYGTRVAGDTLHVLFNAPIGMSNITEYQPLGATGAELQILLVLLLPFLLAQLVYRPVYRLDELAFLVATLYGACVHSRLLFVFMLALIPLAAKLLARWVPPYEPGKDRPGLNLAMIALLGFALFRIFPSTTEIRKDVAEEFPAQAVAYLRQHPINVPMLNDYGWGGYLNWTLQPEHKVFIDGRSQLYEEAGVYGDYLRIMSVDPQVQVLMRKYNLQACLILRNSPLETFLAAQPDWQRVYSDKLSAILVRRPLAVSNR
ncbi:MAG TPA: hypothetical protein VL523_06035 [Terriglobia bacterium]|nr:hypothetical protein [Terriglobia bacterium]